jgi:hypothetical protein
MSNRLDFFVPRRIRQASQPTDVAVGELVIWSDSDTDAVVALYNDADAGIVTL